jgi:hypothetical protein
MRIFLRTVAAAAAVAFTAACTEPAPRSATVAVEGLRVTPQSLVMAVGESRALVAVIVPAGATDTTLRWESEDSAVVRVDASGVVTGRREGSGILVTAFTRNRAFQSSVNVTIVVPSPSGMTGRCAIQSGRCVIRAGHRPSWPALLHQPGTEEQHMIRSFRPAVLAEPKATR